MKANKLFPLFFITCVCFCGFTQKESLFSISHKAGFYNSPFYLKISCKNGQIQFFKENNIHKDRKNVPDSILIDKTQNLCFLLKRKDSTIQLGCFSYFIEFKTKIKVVSISINNGYLFDSIKGIYMKGPNAYYDSVYKHYRNVNFEKKWERENFVEVFDESGNKILNQSAGIKIFGGMTKYLPEKSMRLIARKKYGNSRFNADLYNVGKKKYKQFILRHSGGDYRSLRFKDAMATSLAKESNLDVQESCPAHVFINSEYWGVYNIREKLNEYYIDNHYNCGTKGVDLLQGNSTVDEGRKSDYLKLLKYVRTNDLKNTSAYAKVNEMMDTRSFINFWIYQIYFANPDVRGNIRYWKSDSLDRKFRWIVYDTDLGFSPDKIKRNMLKDFTSPTKTRWYNPKWATFLLRYLLKNETFKTDFINQSAFILSTTLSKDHINKRIDEFKNLYEEEMKIHFSKRKKFQTYQGSLKNWYDCIKGLKYFTKKRTVYSYEHLQEKFNLKKPFKVVLNIYNPKNGTVKINQNIVNNPTFSTFQLFSELEVPITIKPNIGYESTGYSQKTIKGKSGDSLMINITFKKKKKSPEKVIINEIDYTNNCFEVFNQGDKQVNMSGWKIMDLNKNIHLVENLVLPKKRFAVFHFNPISNKIDTVLYQKIDFKLSSKKEKIELFDQNEHLVDEVAYKLKTNKKSYSRNIPFKTFQKVKAKWENNNDLTMGYHNTSYTKILINKKENNKKLIFALVCFAMLFGLIGIYYLKRNKKKRTNSL